MRFAHTPGRSGYARSAYAVAPFKNDAARKNGAAIRITRTAASTEHPHLKIINLILNSDTQDIHAVTYDNIF